MRSENPIMLAGPAGRLEGLYQKAESTDGTGSVLILHPHPLYGGNMHNKVVFTLSKVFGEAGLATLRINFRGVGLSEGRYADGEGEQEDLQSALDFLAAERPGLPLHLAGFSFGAWLALKIGGADPRVASMLGVGSPAGWGDMDWLLPCVKPKFFIHGSRDEYCDPGRLAEEFRRLKEPKRLEWIEGADHFFSDKLEELAACLRLGLPFILKD